MAASNPKHPKSTKISPKETAKTLSNKQKGKGSKSSSTPSHVEPQWTAPSWEDNTPWNWASLTDPSSSRIPPVFTKDGRLAPSNSISFIVLNELSSYFFSLVGSSVKIHSTTTGLVVSTLVAPTPKDGNAQSDVLTSAILNPNNAFQLLTGSLDGKVMIWDFINATLLQTIDVGQPIHYMCGHEQFKGSIFIAASLSRKAGGNGERYNMPVPNITHLSTLKTKMLWSCKFHSNRRITPVTLQKLRPLARPSSRVVLPFLQTVLGWWLPLVTRSTLRKPPL